MGVFTRSDSKYYWLYLETTKRKERTAFLIGTTTAQRRDSRRLADARYHQRMNELAARLYKLPHLQPDISFATYAETYRTHVIAQHRSAPRENEILLVLLRFFGNDPLSAIDQDRVRAYMADRAKTVQPSTFNREVDLLKSMLRDAVPKYLTVSPIVGMRHVRSTKPKRRIMTAEEETKLLAVANQTERALLILGVDGLVRLNDLVDLKRTDRHGKWLYIADPKSGQPYEVALSARAASALDALPAGTEHFFTRYRARTDHDRRLRVRTMLMGLCRKAGVPYGRKIGGLTFHWATRKTGARRMIVEHGKSIPAVQRQGNWKTTEVLLSIYAEADRAAQQDVVLPSRSRARRRPA